MSTRSQWPSARLLIKTSGKRWHCLLSNTLTIDMRHSRFKRMGSPEKSRQLRTDGMLRQTAVPIQILDFEIFD